MNDRHGKPHWGGVWPIDRLGRPRPFGVQWRVLEWDEAANMEVQRTKTEFYETIEKRDARRSQLLRSRKLGSVEHASRSEIAEWRAFLAAVNGAPWQNVVAGWRAWMMQNGVKECSLTVDEAVTESLTNAATAEKLHQLSPDTLRQKTRKLQLFSAQFGHLRLSELSPAEIETWIDDFDEVQSEATFNNYRKHIRAMLQRYVDRGDLLRNPIDQVRKRDDSTGEVGILSVQQTAHLFKFAREHPKYRVAIVRLAFEAFLGLRFSSGCRLEKDDIKYADRGVLLPKHKLKTKKRHYVDGMPAHLWSWVLEKDDSGWEDLTARQYMQLKSGLFVEAGVPHPHNVLRHSFATYDLAAHKNPGRTAYLLCHRNQDLLWSRYKGNASEADGKAYQSITPETVEKLAAGYVPLRPNAVLRKVQELPG